MAKKKKVTLAMFQQKLGEVTMCAWESMRTYDEMGVKHMGNKYRRRYTKPNGQLKDKYI